MFDQWEIEDLECVFYFPAIKGSWEIEAEPERCEFRFSTLSRALSEVEEIPQVGEVYEWLFFHDGLDVDCCFILKQVVLEGDFLVCYGVGSGVYEGV